MGHVILKFSIFLYFKDNRRYYRVRWRATWEPEEELLDKYQNLIEDYWKVTVEEQNNLEHKNLINNLLENISV